MVRSIRMPRRGAITVEFAFVMPLLFSIVFGIIELAWVFYQDHTIHEAARQAARLGAIHMTAPTNWPAVKPYINHVDYMSDQDLRNWIKSFCLNLGVTDANIVIERYDGASNGVKQAGASTDNLRQPGEDLRVSIVHNIKFLTFLQTFFQSVGISQLQAESQFTIEPADSSG